MTVETVFPVPGLSSGEAARRLQRDGPNVLPSTRDPSWVRALAGQLSHFFAVMLWVAAGLAFLVDMPQLAVAIAVMVILNGVFAFGAARQCLRLPQRDDLGRGKPLRTNQMLVAATVVELGLLLAVVGIPYVAELLGGAWPSVLGWTLAAAVVPSVVLVDLAYKQWAARFVHA